MIRLDNSDVEVVEGVVEFFDYMTERAKDPQLTKALAEDRQNWAKALELAGPRTDGGEPDALTTAWTDEDKERMAEAQQAVARLAAEDPDSSSGEILRGLARDWGGFVKHAPQGEEATA